jgi:hypothetical protein
MDTCTLTHWFLSRLIIFAAWYAAMLPVTPGKSLLLNNHTVP